jgi:hypothetical protein
MVKMAYRTQDGKIAILNTANDKCLWSGRWLNGVQQDRFEELFYHRTKSGKVIFYIAHRTFWQGESDSITVLDDSEVMDWIIEHFGSLDYEEITELRELGYIVEENA